MASVNNQSCAPIGRFFRAIASTFMRFVCCRNSYDLPRTMDTNDSNRSENMNSGSATVTFTFTGNDIVQTPESPQTPPSMPSTEDGASSEDLTDQAVGGTSSTSDEAALKENLKAV